MPARLHLETIIWRRCDVPGMEHASLLVSNDARELTGVVILSSGEAHRLDYTVACDAAWRTRRVSVRAARGTTASDVTVRVDDEGRWWVNGEARADLADCLDIDLGFSPSTNTLPIRRLQLSIGEQADIRAAWMRFPELDVQPVWQRYRRLADRLYRYENPESGFRADVLVDAEGLVVQYPPGWERVEDGPSERYAGPLFSTGRAADISEDEDLYGWLLGSWDLDVIDHDANGGRRTGKGEVHFAWVLEGRAIQDVWIMPPRSERRAGELPAIGNRYGTTIRAYDPAIRAWRVTWINPATGAHNELIGRRVAGEIVQEGMDAGGAAIRWRFVDIRPDAFRWIGETSRDGGATWTTGAEFIARRTGTRPLR